MTGVRLELDANSIPRSLPPRSPPPPLSPPPLSPPPPLVHVLPGFQVRAGRPNCLHPNPRADVRVPRKHQHSRDHLLRGLLLLRDRPNSGRDVDRHFPTSPLCGLGFRGCQQRRLYPTRHRRYALSSRNVPSLCDGHGGFRRLVLLCCLCGSWTLGPPSRPHMRLHLPPPPHGCN